MKTNCLIIVAVFICVITETKAQVPNWLWAKTIGASNDCEGYAVATDASGNVYSTGYFSGIVDFVPGPGVYN